MAVAFCLFVVIFVTPAWLSILPGRQLSSPYRTSVLLVTCSFLLQIVFVICVGERFLALDHSIRFAAAGIPLCILGLVLALRGSQRREIPRGVVVSASLGLAMWMLLVMMH
jgi:hypothetical protein